MNVETLYEDDIPVGAPSASTVFLRRIITILWFASWLFFSIFLVSIIIAALGLSGVEPIKSQAFTEADPITTLIMALSGLVYISVLLVILKQLQKICKTLTAGDPFVPENAKRLRLIWIAVASGEILRQFGAFLFSYLNNKGIISYAPAGSTVAGTDITVDLRIYVWFLVLAFVIFAEVFREGARLRQEQKLTV